MTTQRRTTVAVSALALFGFGLFVGGCGPSHRELACCVQREYNCGSAWQAGGRGRSRDRITGMTDQAQAPDGIRASAGR